MLPSGCIIKPPGKPTPPPFGPSRGSGKPLTPLARMHFDTEAGRLGAPYGYFGLWYPVDPELPHAATITVVRAASKGTVDAWDATSQL